MEFGFSKNYEVSEQTINIGSEGATEVERVLSNFAPTPFELDGTEYACVEALWQSLKFPEGSEKRREVSQMDGRSAKKAVRKLKTPEFVEYNGEFIAVGSPSHHLLAERAIRAKFEQNAEARSLLLSTGNAFITHELRYPDGTLLPDSRTLPREVFCHIVMQVRRELREEK